MTAAISALIMSARILAKFAREMGVANLLDALGLWLQQCAHSRRQRHGKHQTEIEIKRAAWEAKR